VGRMATEIAHESRAQEFGLTWPYGRQGDAPCAEYRGATDDRISEDYWVFRCGRSDGLGRVDWFYYDLLPDSLATMERWQRTIEGPVGSDSLAWHRAFEILVDALSKDWAATPSVSTTYDGPIAVFPADRGHLSVTLDMDSPEIYAPKLTIDLQSARIDARLRSTLRPSDPGWLAWALAEDDSIMAASRKRDADALRRQEPALARALGRVEPDPRDTVALFEALKRAEHADVTQRDRLLYGSDRWIRWLFYDGEDSALVARIGRAVRPFGVAIVGQSRVWTYEGGLLKPLEPEPWRNEWRERVFLEWMEGLCNFTPDEDAWRKVLARGDEFLTRAPTSQRAPEIVLHMAEAHETAWSVAFTIDPYMSDYAEYRANAGSHRGKAIELYMRYLDLRPDAPGRGDILFRIQRLRRNIDTGFQKYYCYSDC
jgi:hypothetical protein